MAKVKLDVFRTADKMPPKGIPVIVQGGTAMLKTGGEWLPGSFGPAPELRWQGQGPIYDANQFPSDMDREPKWDDGLSYVDEDEQVFFYKAGKKASGRLLDGVEHNGFPKELNSPSRA